MPPSSCFPRVRYQSSSMFPGCHSMSCPIMFQVKGTESNESLAVGIFSTKIYYTLYTIYYIFIFYLLHYLYYILYTTFYIIYIMSNIKYNMSNIIYYVLNVTYFI
jgi:hypothetical protein